MKVKNLRHYVPEGTVDFDAIYLLNEFIRLEEYENGPEAEVSIQMYENYLRAHQQSLSNSTIKQFLGNEPEAPHFQTLRTIFHAWEISDALQARIALLDPPSQASEQITFLNEFIAKQHKERNTDFSLKAYKIFLHKDKKMGLPELESFLKGPLESNPALQAAKTFFADWQTQETTRLLTELETWKQDALTNLDIWKTAQCGHYDDVLKERYKHSDIDTMAKRLKALTKGMSKKEAKDYVQGNNPELDLLTKLIAYRKAEKSIQEYAQMQARHPDCTIESIITKRHETARITHKLFGLNRDTPLTTLHHSWLTPQKRTDFLLTQQINGFFIDALGDTDTISSKKVRVLSSSLSRAMETVAYATLPGENVSHVEVSGDFAEMKLGLLPKRVLSLSADPRGEPQGRVHAAEIFEQAPGFEKIYVIAPEGAFVGKGFNLKQQDIRVQSAAIQLITQPPSLSARLSVTYLVAHGGVIRHILQKIKGSFSKDPRAGFPCSIPPGTIPHGNLKYGDSYELLVARRLDGSIAELDYKGKYSRFGKERPASIMTVKEFQKQTSKIGTIRSAEIKAIDRDLAALTKFAKGKKGKTKSSPTLFKAKPEGIRDKDAYNAKVGELLGKVNALVRDDRTLIRQEGLHCLKEQLETYLKKVNPPSLTPSPSNREEKKLEL